METKIIVGLCLWIIGIVVGICMIIRQRKFRYGTDWKQEVLLGLIVIFALLGWGVMVYGPAGLWMKILHFISSFGMSFPLG